MVDIFTRCALFNGDWHSMRGIKFVVKMCAPVQWHCNNFQCFYSHLIIMHRPTVKIVFICDFKRVLSLTRKTISRVLIDYVPSAYSLYLSLEENIFHLFLRFSIANFTTIYSFFIEVNRVHRCISVLDEILYMYYKLLGKIPLKSIKP